MRPAEDEGACQVRREPARAAAALRRVAKLLRSASSEAPPRQAPSKSRQATLRHEWLADLLGGRPTLGPNALAVMEATLAALDTVMRAVETVSAYFTGAIRREIANLRAERATGLSKRDWQRASGPHLRRMLATGRFPALSKAVYDGTEVDAEATFATGLDWVLDAVAAKLAQPQA
ncbi:TetR/AcrR family transcriptional regulator C-terminal domain-containing protein [Nonomuraea sp. NPDC050691]|uniref:TetR/AcrR family transcriptional regulator C-terminal domain-containing protein n=1 Tax=Nonomuraea sp. NPDC050691 TaxID=3155661 RepID=UPI0033E77136